MERAVTIAQARNLVAQWKAQGETVGFVPTMGCLHEGHLSLMAQGKAECHRVVVSVFVNPTQFGANEDFDKYPRDIERDAKLCEEAGVDLLFCPAVEELYSKGYATYVEQSELTEHLCGKSRPGHFRGVCTVVSKLFHIVAPDKAFFGEKDAQQLQVIRRMVEDLNFDIEIVGCPTVREADGLAKSSRNRYLSPAERRAATVLSRGLSAGLSMLQRGEQRSNAVIEAVLAELELEPLAQVDYVELVDYNTLEPIAKVAGEVMLALAVYIGTTRLIDHVHYRATEE